MNKLYLWGKWNKMHDGLVQLLKGKGIKPTAMRLLVLDYLMGREAAVSLLDVERGFGYSDRITLYRTLKTFEEKMVVHSIQDGSGSVKYALCLDDCVGESHADLHLHFHCRVCAGTYCLPRVRVPNLGMPEGYALEDVNLIAKGVCERCGKNAIELQEG